MKLGIRKVKTLAGLKYGVVNLETEPVIVEKVTKFKAKEIDVVETKIGVALFSLNSIGLQKAHELKDALCK